MAVKQDVRKSELTKLYHIFYEENDTKNGIIPFRKVIPFPKPT
jgi:hypothetical protein